MKIAHYTNIGKRQKNEDSLGFNKNCLIVCDGVGGAAFGEFVSSFVVKEILKRTALERIKTENDFERIIHEVQSKLNSLVIEDENLNGAATTIAVIYMSKNGLFTFHMGDTRIIIVRNSKFWQTWDHSVVSEMVKLGELNQKDIKQHPLRNQITRAVIANSDDKKRKPEVNFLSDIQKGDIGFICSDGVLEVFSEQELLFLLGSRKMSIDDKLIQIRTRCKELSDDNNTAIIVEFDDNDVKYFSNYPTKWKNIDSIS